MQSHKSGVQAMYAMRSGMRDFCSKLSLEFHAPGLWRKDSFCRLEWKAWWLESANASVHLIYLTRITADRKHIHEHSHTHIANNTNGGRAINSLEPPWHRRQRAVTNDWRDLTFYTVGVCFVV